MGADLSHERAQDATGRGSPTPPASATRTAAAASPPPKGLAVGIDLGTTYSCVAVCRRGRVDVVANDHGNRTTPSCVAFTDKERLVGEPGELLMGLQPENTISCAKRLMGRRYEDPLVQSDRRHWPFRVAEGAHGRAKVQVTDRGMEKSFYPEEISAMVLAKLKRAAEDYLGRPVTQAVVTVPAYFGDAQRQATVDAGAIAGLRVLQLMNEPSAAALAYGLHEGRRWKARRSTLLVFDLGGGTFDASVLSARDGVFEVVATAGDTHLGGEDFDRRLADHLAQEFQRRHNEDLSQSPKAVRRLKAACERAKRALSSNVTALVSVDSLHKGLDFHATVTRATFEDLCADLFQATLLHVERALGDAGLEATQVDDVVLVGGSTRIPKIRKLLSGFFHGKDLCRGINPDEAVAQGAAIQAAILTGHRYQSVQNLLLLDVTPLSLGLETVGGVMDVVVKRNSPVPTKETRNFSTTEDNQSSLLLQVYEGERTLTKHNRLLGTFTLTGLQPAPRCVPVIVVTFHIDQNNLLTVSAMERSTGNANQLTLADSRGRLDREAMEGIIREEEEYRAREKAEKEKMEALNSLESSALQLKRVAVQEKSLDDRAKRRVLEMCEETVAWMEGNQLAPKKEYEQRKRELEDICYSVITHFRTDGENP